MERSKADETHFRALFSLKALYSFGYNLIAPILPAFLTTLTSSAAQISLVPASYQLSRVLGALFFGHASDRLGHRRAILVSLGIAIVMSLLLLGAKSIGDFAVIFFCIGISSGIFYISLDAIATTLQEKKGRTLAGLETAYFVGFLAGPLLGGYAAQQFGMPAVFALCAVLMAVTLVFVRSVRLQSPKHDVSIHSAFSEMKSIFQNTPRPKLFSFAASTFVIGFVETSFWLIIPLYAVSLGFDLVSVGIITAIAALITALGVGHFGSLSDRLGRRTSLLASMGLVVAACLLLTLFHSFFALALLAGVFSLGRSGGYVNTRAYSADLASPRHRASAISVQELFFTFGRTLGPLAAGLMLDAFGAIFAFWALALVAIANILLLWFLPEGIGANKKAGR